MGFKRQQKLEKRLPDPFKMISGALITSVEGWKEKRRPEVLELFRRYVYGRTAVGRPENLSFTLLNEDHQALNGSAIRKEIEVTFSGPGGTGHIPVLLFTPSHSTRPSPCFLLINNRGKETYPADFSGTPFWPVERIIDRGYATAVFDVADVDPDEHDGFRNGVHGIFDPPGKQRAEDAWGTIAAWAWGASRVMDYLETDPDLDAKRTAVLGHSRGGKTALWCGAQDERFALTISNESGCTGAALARGTTGETVAQINTQFPHWFCEAYKQFNDQEERLPVDQHLLLALMAPRLVYVASAQGDAWAGPENEFLACVHAEPVFHLFGLKGVETREMPKVGTPLHQGAIGYHMRTGQHDLTVYDWERFMDFATLRWNE